MDETLRNLLVDLLVPANTEATIDRLVDTCALAAAGKSDDVRAGAVAWLRSEVIESLSKLDEFSGKDLSPIADFVADRLTKRIAEIEASTAGSA